MNTFYLTRKEMASLLLALRGKTGKSALVVLQDAWSKSHKRHIQHGKSFDAFISTSLPPIFEKIIKFDKDNAGLSLNDIVSLGNQIEYTNFSVTSIQNWVKRDVKDVVGGPKVGKRYSIEQTAVLFLVDDLKTSLDFESIRKLLTMIFKDPHDDADDLISPTDLYAAYASMFEDLDGNNDQVLDVSGHELGLLNHDHMLEGLIKKRAEQYVRNRDDLDDKQKEAVSNVLVIAMVCVQTAYFQTMARKVMNATLFLNNM